ncbi:Uncharacterized protein APZ42_025220 [Daphnia magna]|uniref:Uncharacterized protein n=1 Tax=Daphnia magna TaxID=35525 RepID=A0A164TC32_9CRUS|nr:Uncharacterized protein APZ42_025220 [Daphnia magna]
MWTIGVKITWLLMFLVKFFSPTMDAQSSFSKFLYITGVLSSRTRSCFVFLSLIELCQKFLIAE